MPGAAGRTAIVIERRDFPAVALPHRITESSDLLPHWIG
jgi:hypothetical protein